MTASCATDRFDGDSGTLTIDLIIKSEAQVDEVLYIVTGNGIDPISDTIDTSAPGSTISVEVFGIPAGRNYQVELSATTVDGTMTCRAVAPFEVIAGKVTLVHLLLRCVPPEDLGGVRVNAEVNYCPKVIKAMAAPLRTSIGNDISLYAIASDPEDDPIEYRWTGTGGRFADPNAAATTYTCEKEGDHWLTVEVSDDGFDFCHRYWKVLITCVRDGGGTGGTGGGGGTGGTGGTGGIIVNYCAFWTSILISPTQQSVSNLIDVATRVHDLDGDDVEVRVSSDCGEVADPLQTADPGTGEADTTVRCDHVTQCEILIHVSDTGFVGCTGTDRGASSRTQIDCDPQ
jgi:hypothetical protein